MAFLPVLAVFGTAAVSLLPNCGTTAFGTQDAARLPVKLPADWQSQSPVSASQVAAGWIALFDGQSLFGWRHTSSANWRVEDGAIVVDEGPPGLLRTASQFDDFELLMRFDCHAETDVSVLLRTSPQPGFHDAIAVRLAGPDQPGRTGELTGRQASRGVRWQDGGTQEMRVTVRRQTVQVQWNGAVVNQWESAVPPVRRGYIGLQYQRGRVRFRRILLRPLFDEESFAEASLSAWRAAGSDSFEVSREGPREFVLRGGPGYLESRRSFANFVLQLQCQISRGGNSGVFYRCIPGENTNGYESQIDNSRQAADATKPANGGTGGIFRRRDARRIVAEDESWFAKTIVAEGPHVAVWVNGYQVTDWTDQRRPDVNPRRGLRMQAGTLMLQGHDPETTVGFRDIRVRELQPRR
jgi:hypothetical protein